MSPHVCVVGAGVAGLQCAAVLLENGFEVTILEARDRIGGRITQSNEMGPLEVDLGANWVHSSVHNPIIELARQTGTELHSWNSNTLIVDSSGNLIDRDRGNKALQAVWAILEEAIDHSKTKGHQIDPSESLFDFFKDHCELLIRHGTADRDEVDLVLSMSQMWGAYVGAKIERQSLKYFFLEDCIEEDDYFIPTNYMKIMAEIARRPMKHARIVLNAQVTSIHAPQDVPGVHIEIKSLPSEIFDAVVVTTPLGWLKRHATSIEPLSAPMKLAIESISYGNLEKVLIEFPNPFWEQSPDSPTSFVHWLSPAYTHEASPGTWRLECVCFTSFASPYRRNILLFYTYGECAIHITSMIKGKTGTQRDLFLREFFEPYYSRLPGWDAGVCAPSRLLATEWANDEFAGFGSYCNFQVGIERADEHVKTLRHGMPEHGIYFAGEHTAPFNGLGTVSGAYTSGQSIAERLVERCCVR